MSLRTFRKLTLFVLSTFVLSIVGGPLLAAKPAGSSRDKSGDVSDKPEQVELFKAIETGDIEVRLFAKDSKGGNVVITNKTKKPLQIKLPEAFGAAPVLAQFGGGGLGGGGLGGGGLGGGGLGGGGLGGGGGQGLGGGFGGGGGGLGGGGFGGGGGGLGGGGGGGFFNVGPEKVGKIKVQTVCLEHGKPDPNLRMRYELRPIESMTGKSDVVQLCKMLGRGEIPQNAAQAAAWNLANGLSWGELASKDRVKHLDGSSEKYFSPAELEIALRIANEAQRRGQAEPVRSINPQVNTPGRQQ